MGESEFDLNDFVEKESNIWACIYRSINRKKDTNEYDEENEDSKLLLAQSFKFASTQAFKDFSYKRFTNKMIPKPMASPVKKQTQVSEIKEAEDEDGLDSLPVSRLNSKADNIGKNVPENEEHGEVNLLKVHRIPGKQSSSSKIIPKFQNTVGGALGVKPRNASGFKNAVDQFKVEEMLVVYYVATVIRLSKFSDGLKAINEYKKKKGLSKITQAHIYKLLGVLTMLAEKKDYQKAKKYLIKAGECFSEAECRRGLAITKLAILRCDCEISFNKHLSMGELSKMIESSEKCKLDLGKLAYKEGEQRAQLYIDCLKNKINGEESGNFRRTLKNKSIVVKHFNKTKAVGTLMNAEVLQDEDIKLFVEVVEKPDTIQTPDLIPSKPKPKAPELQTQVIRHKDLEEAKLQLAKEVKESRESKFMKDYKDSKEEPKKIEKLSKIRNISSKKKFAPPKEGLKAKKRRKETAPLEMEKLPSIIANREASINS